MSPSRFSIRKIHILSVGH